MYRILRNLYLKNIKNRKKLRCEKNVLITNSDEFEGSNLLSDDVVFVDSHLGYASYVGRKSEIYQTYIGRYSCIGPKVSVVLGQHPTRDFVSIHPAFFSIQEQIGFTFIKENKFNEHKSIDGKYAVQIGNDVWIGQGSMIMEGLHISDGAIIAAGSVVTTDVPPYAIVGGIPAKIIRYRFSKDQIDYLTELQWWKKDKDWLSANAEYFESIETLMHNI